MPMNFFKRLKGLFSSKKEEKPAEEVTSHKGEGQILLKMQCGVVHPYDLKEPLLMAIVSRTLLPAWANVTDIKLYSLYDRDNNSFVGSFYALEREDGFYGNIVGSPEIWFLEKDAFIYKKTKELFVPLEKEAGKVLALVCKYKPQKALLTACCLVRADVGTMQNREIVHGFKRRTSFGEAYAFYQETMKD